MVLYDDVMLYSKDRFYGLEFHKSDKTKRV